MLVPWDVTQNVVGKTKGNRYGIASKAEKSSPAQLVLTKVPRTNSN